MTSDLPDFRKHYTWRSYSAPFYFPFFNSYVEVNLNLFEFVLIFLCENETYLGCSFQILNFDISNISWV